MDTASSNSSKIQSFSVMSCIPQELNRDKVLSLISSISKVVAFNIVQIVSQSGEYFRIGVAKVVDTESIYRLTSRRFLVGPNQAIKFCRVPEDSKLVRHSVNQDIQLCLKFSSPEKTFFHQVVDFVNKIGDVKMVSMKGQACQSELLFKVPANFSLKEYTTELSLDISGCTVSAHYTEDCFSLDYFKQELEMIKELISSNSSDLPVEVSEKAQFFRPQTQFLGMPVLSSGEYEPFSTSLRKVALFEKTYDIVEDDLSESESEEDFGRGSEFEQIFKPLESEQGHHNGICFFNKENDFGFFREKSLFVGQSDSSQTRQEFGAFEMSGVSLQNSEKGPIGKRNIFGSDAHTHSSNGSSYQNLNGDYGKTRFGEVFALNNRGQPLHWNGQANAQPLPSKNFQSKPTTAPEPIQGHDSQHLKKESTDAAKNKSQTSQRIRPSSKLRDDRTKGRAHEELSSNKKGVKKQGPNILDRISPGATDLKELNEKYMPQIKEVWRRFWMIKNEIKREKKIEEEAKKNSTGNKPNQSSYGLHLEQSDLTRTKSSTRVSST